MRAFLSRAARLFRDPKGATAVEYGLILALIVLAIMGALLELGSITSGLWTNVSTKVQAVGTQ
ncbi:Flp family type IVb pilin [Sphingomonas sp.]|uniref:Flp family type IVb pilin n=1 Tax=Sphingomonas sp. TaxID=28214 RepID=UPI001B075905|nr:Flp family type IVb pilin [Sphingomonas sp.]MBO9711603.1 Flp family type IVb pilin [Sphingomonas sp.]